MKQEFKTYTAAKDLTFHQKLDNFIKENGTLVVVACGAVNILGVFIYLFFPHTTNQRVVSHRWSRTITLQENIEMHGEGWRSAYDFTPGVSLTCESRRRGSHDCNPHTVIRYDSHGHVRRRTYYDRCDSYDDWCHAVWREWTDISASEIHGTEYTDEWPRVVAVGQFQRLQRTWLYSVSFDNGKVIECDQNTYASIAVGSFQTIRWFRGISEAELMRR